MSTTLSDDLTRAKLVNGLCQIMNSEKGKSWHAAFLKGTKLAEMFRQMEKHLGIPESQRLDAASLQLAEKTDSFTASLREYQEKETEMSVESFKMVMLSLLSAYKKIDTDDSKGVDVALLFNAPIYNFHCMFSGKSFSKYVLLLLKVTGAESKLLTVQSFVHKCISLFKYVQHQMQGAIDVMFDVVRSTFEDSSSRMLNRFFDLKTMLKGLIKPLSGFFTCMLVYRVCQFTSMHEVFSKIQETSAYVYDRISDLLVGLGMGYTNFLKPALVSMLEQVDVRGALIYNKTFAESLGDILYTYHSIRTTISGWFGDANEKMLYLDKKYGLRFAGAGAMTVYEVKPDWFELPTKGTYQQPTYSNATTILGSRLGKYFEKPKYRCAEASIRSEVSSLKASNRAILGSWFPMVFRNASGRTAENVYIAISGQLNIEKRPRTSADVRVFYPFDFENPSYFDWSDPSTSTKASVPRQGGEGAKKTFIDATAMKSFHLANKKYFKKLQTAAADFDEYLFFIPMIHGGRVVVSVDSPLVFTVNEQGHLTEPAENTVNTLWQLEKADDGTLQSTWSAANGLNYHVIFQIFEFTINVFSNGAKTSSNVGCDQCEMYGNASCVASYGTSLFCSLVSNTRLGSSPNPPPTPRGCGHYLPRSYIMQHIKNRFEKSFVDPTWKKLILAPITGSLVTSGYKNVTASMAARGVSASDIPPLKQEYGEIDNVMRVISTQLASNEHDADADGNHLPGGKMRFPQDYFTKTYGQFSWWTALEGYKCKLNCNGANAKENIRGAVVECHFHTNNKGKKVVTITWHADLSKPPLLLTLNMESQRALLMAEYGKKADDIISTVGFDGPNAVYNPLAKPSKFVVSPLYQACKTLSHMLQIGIFRHDHFEPERTRVFPNQGPVDTTRGNMSAPEDEVRCIEWFHGLPQDKAAEIGFVSPWDRGYFYMNNPEQVPPGTFDGLETGIGPFYDFYSRTLHEMGGEDNGMYTYAYDEPLWPTVLNQLFGKEETFDDAPYYTLLHLSPVANTIDGERIDYDEINQKFGYTFADPNDSKPESCSA